MNEKIIYAKYIYPTNGYPNDQNDKRLKVDETYRVVTASVGLSYTSVVLYGIKGSFNSVLFEYFDSENNPVDIVEEFGRYLTHMDDYI